MCGRFASYLPPEALRAVFGTAKALINQPPDWNVAPTRQAMIVRRHPESGARHLDLLRWGPAPHFTKDLKAARKPINARSESHALDNVRNSGAESLARIDDPNAPPPSGVPAGRNPA